MWLRQYCHCKGVMAHIKWVISRYSHTVIHLTYTCVQTLRQERVFSLVWMRHITHMHELSHAHRHRLTYTTSDIPPPVTETWYHNYWRGDGMLTLIRVYYHHCVTTILLLALLRPKYQREERAKWQASCQKLTIQIQLSTGVTTRAHHSPLTWLFMREDGEGLRDDMCVSITWNCWKPFADMCLNTFFQTHTDR